jgi:hypothetical protein
MPSTRKKRKVSDLTVDDANVLLRTLAEFQEQLDEEDEDIPSGLISGLEQLRKKLEVIPHTPFSKVDALTLLQVQIKSAPLLLSPDVMSNVRSLGVSTRAPGRELSMDTLNELIGLVQCHVSLVTEAGCRILINMILLRVVSAMSTDETDVNIIPEFPIAKTTFPSSLSFGGVVDLLLTKLPSRFTRYLLLDPTSALGNPEAIDGPMTSNFFEAKRDNVRAAIPQAVIAVASHCTQHGIPVLRGCTTSGDQWIFFVYSVNDSGGGRVACSDEFSLGQQLEGLPLILGLLTDWVDHATAYDQQFFTYK